MSISKVPQSFSKNIILGFSSKNFFYYFSFFLYFFLLFLKNLFLKRTYNFWRVHVISVCFVWKTSEKSKWILVIQFVWSLINFYIWHKPISLLRVITCLIIWLIILEFKNLLWHWLITLIFNFSYLNSLNFFTVFS